MSEEKLPLAIPGESSPTVLVKRDLLNSLRDEVYRHAFVCERVRSSVALQIRALREQRDMTQKKLGDAIGMAQTWVSKLENPDYGKMTVATLLRLAEAFNTDLEIKFRPFSTTVDTLPTQGPDYFAVPSFNEELSKIEAQLDAQERNDKYWRAVQGDRAPIALDSTVRTIGPGNRALAATAEALSRWEIAATPQELSAVDPEKVAPIPAAKAKNLYETTTTPGLLSQGD